MSKYYILNPDWQLRGYQKGVRLCLNWRSGARRFLNPSELVCAQMCDGKTDFDSPAVLPVLRKWAARLQSEGIVRPCACGTELYDGQAYRQAPNSYIDSLLLSITNRCNFRCRHCFVEAWKDRYGEFSREDLFCLLDQFEQANVADIALTGGEPLMSPYFKEFVRALAARRIGFTEIFTNAALIDGELLDVIADAGFRPYFKVSFDCSGSHDYMRGVKGAEESTLRGIRLLRERGFSVTVITSIDKVVIERLTDTLHLLASLGVDNWWMAPPMEIGAWRGTDSGVDVNSLLPALKGVLVEWLQCGRPFDMMLWRLGRYHKTGRIFRGMPSFTGESFDCSSIHSLAYVAPDGTLLPCGSYTGSDIMGKFPNLLRTPLTVAWDDPFLRSFCDLKKKDVQAANPGCRECEHFSECGTGCRVSAMNARGDWMKNDPVCCQLHRSGLMRDFHDFARSLDSDASEVGV